MLRDQLASGAQPMDPSAGQINHSLPMRGRGSDHTWIRFANHSEDRRLRRRAAWQTLCSCLIGTPFSGKASSSVQISVETTQLVLVAPPSGEAASAGLPEIVYDQRLTLDIAVARAQEGAIVAAVNAASAYHSGGGFLTGGRHALEEAMCMQSTLFPSLQRAAHLAQMQALTCPDEAVYVTRGRDGKFYERHVPRGGAVLSPGVHVVRGGSNDGYPFLLAPVRLAGIVSITAPNKNPSVSDSPLDAPDDPEEYANLLRQTFGSAMHAATLCGATEVVMPDVGCGVFENDPAVVGAALGYTIARYKGTVKKVHLTGKPAFHEACAVELGLMSPCSPAAQSEPSARGSRGQYERGSPSATGSCRNGCGRSPFKSFPTCCTHCRGAEGPHARDCNRRHGY